LIEREVIAGPIPDRGQSSSLGSGTAAISMKNAGGAYVVGVRINGATSRIGDRAVQNIVASIGSVKGEPLLGQSFLSRFASWSVDNNRHALVLGELRHSLLRRLGHRLRGWQFSAEHLRSAMAP
jgi:predicted aspartyl protease